MIGLAELRKLAGGVLTLATAPVRILVTIDVSLRNLDRIADGVDAMHGEFLGMREDIRGLSGQIEVLTAEVSTLEAPIEGIYGEMPLLNARVEKVDERMAELAGDLKPIGALAGRFGIGRGKRSREVEIAEGEPPRELPR